MAHPPACLAPPPFPPPIPLPPPPATPPGAPFPNPSPPEQIGVRGLSGRAPLLSGGVLVGPGRGEGGAVGEPGTLTHAGLTFRSAPTREWPQNAPAGAYLVRCFVASSCLPASRSDGTRHPLPPPCRRGFAPLPVPLRAGEGKAPPPCPLRPEGVCASPCPLRPEGELRLPPKCPPPHRRGAIATVAGPSSRQP